MSSLAPSSAPSLATPPTKSTTCTFPKPTPSSPPLHSSSSDEESDLMPAESAAAPLAFPSIPRPKGIAERAVLKKTTGSSSGSGLLKPMLRKRSDSLKWSKYQGMASFELDLSPDELKRV